MRIRTPFIGRRIDRIAKAELQRLSMVRTMADEARGRPRAGKPGARPVHVHRALIFVHILQYLCTFHERFARTLDLHAAA
jgi:hypothetical protein